MSLTLAALAALLPATALAHQVGLSRGTYVAHDGEVDAHIALSRLDVLTSVDGIDADGNGILSADELAAKKADVGRLFLDKTRVAAGGAACTGALASLALEDPDGVAIDLVFTCPTDAGAVSLDLGFVDDIGPGHRHLFHAEGAGAPIDDIAYRQKSHVDLAFKHTAGQATSGGFSKGLRRVATSVDLIVFAFGLLLVAAGWKRAARLGAAFTFGVATTFVLTAGGWIAPAPRVIATATALTVVYIGLDDLFAVKATERWSRWPAALSLGAIHGLGLGLSAVAANGATLLGPNALFDAGVGVALVALLLGFPALLQPLRTRAWFERRLEPALAAVVALIGVARVILVVSGRAP